MAGGGSRREPLLRVKHGDLVKAQNPDAALFLGVARVQTVDRTAGVAP